MKKIVVIDGQGGRIGAMVITKLKAERSEQEIYAIGTNSIATAAMVKAGANYGATGENPVVVSSRNADIIVGPLGIIAADSLIGEVTPAMAVAVGQSAAQKVLLPVNKCNHFVVGMQDKPFQEIIELAVKHIVTLL